MKKNLIYILTLSLLLIACEDKRLDGLEPDKIYLPKAGMTVEESYAIGVDAIADLWTYKSSLNGTSCVVEYTMQQSVLDEYNAANGTDYLLLPEDCYTIPNSKITIVGQEQYAKFQVIYSPEKIIELCRGVYELEKYALPFMISSTDIDITERNSAILVFKVKEPVVKMAIKKTINVEFNAGETGSITQPIEFGMAFKSKWNCKFEIETDQSKLAAILDEYNAENISVFSLLPQDAYSLSSTDGQITTGNSMVSLLASIDKSKVKGGNYAIVVAIKSVEQPLKLSAQESYTIIPVLSLAEYVAKTGWTIAVSSCNPNWGVPLGAGLIDNDLSTYWHPAGRKFSESIPQDPLPTATVDMKKMVNVSCFELDPRQDQFYPTAYSNLKCYVSEDGVNFNQVAIVAKPWTTTVNNTKDKCIVPVKNMRGRYVRFTFNYTGSAIAFAELNIRGVEANAD